MYSIAALLVVIALSLLVTRVATVILTASGMSRAAARFQARSAFTGAGFTTTESEDVIDHPVRRKVIMWLMFLGNAGIVAGAGTLIIGFRSGGAGQPAWRVLELALGLLALLYISRSRWVDRRLNRLIHRVLERHTDLPTRDSDSLVELGQGWTVSELVVSEGDWLATAPVGALDLGSEGVQVLGLKRGDAPFRPAPVDRVRLQDADYVVLFGHDTDLADLDHRPAGSEGDRRHRAAVAAHRDRDPTDGIDDGN